MKNTGKKRGKSSANGGTADSRAVVERALRDLRVELEAEWAKCQTDLRREDEGFNEDDDASAGSSATFAARTMDHLSKRIRDVNSALGRLEAGTYGVCEDCENGIDADRLSANPAATRCRTCQERSERGARRSA